MTIHEDTLLLDPDADFEAHYRAGSDPDADCPRLCLSHLLLWGRRFDGIGPFTFTIERSSGYVLRLRDERLDATFVLASDAMNPTWSTGGWHDRLAMNVRSVAANSGPFYRLTCTLGEYIMFPRNNLDQTGSTINQARGTRCSIADRFDLTLECIRRHYNDREADNPLRDRLDAYADFFALFGTFDTYTRFFLLDDLVTDDGCVRSLFTGGALHELPRNPLPDTAEQYRQYQEHTSAFLTGRNSRIRELPLRVTAHPPLPACTLCPPAAGLPNPAG